MSAVDPASSPSVVGLTRQLPGSSSDVQTILSGVLRIADGLIVPGASVIAYWLWHGTLTLPTFYLTPTLLGAVLAVNFLHLFGAYTADALRRPALQLSKAAAGWMVTSATLVAIAYLTSTSIFYSRGWALLWLVFTLSGFVILRASAAVRIARWRQQGLPSTRVAIIGTGELARLVARQLEDAPDQEYRIVGFFSFRSGAIAAGIVPKGGIETLLAAVSANHVDEVLIALPWGGEHTLEALLKQLGSVP